MSNKAINSLKLIRDRLAMSQTELGAVVGVTRAMVSQYEAGLSPFPPESARKLIAAAKERGETVTFDDIYADPSQTIANRNSEQTHATV